MKKFYKRYSIVDGKQYIQFNKLNEAKNYVKNNLNMFDVNNLDIDYEKINIQENTFEIITKYVYIPEKNTFQKVI